MKAFHLICLGDSEELWENTLTKIKRHNLDSFAAERKFLLRHKFTKVFGNHDLDWEINSLSDKELLEIYRNPVIAMEGIILESIISGKTISFFCSMAIRAIFKAMEIFSANSLSPRFGLRCKRIFTSTQTHRHTTKPLKLNTIV